MMFQLLHKIIVHRNGFIVIDHEDSFFKVLVCAENFQLKL